MPPCGKGGKVPPRGEGGSFAHLLAVGLRRGGKAPPCGEGRSAPTPGGEKRPRAGRGEVPPCGRGEVPPRGEGKSFRGLRRATAPAGPTCAGSDAESLAGGRRGCRSAGAVDRTQTGCCEYTYQHVCVAFARGGLGFRRGKASAPARRGQTRPRAARGNGEGRSAPARRGQRGAARGEARAAAPPRGEGGAFSAGSPYSQSLKIGQVRDQDLGNTLH